MYINYYVHQVNMYTPSNQHRQEQQAGSLSEVPCLGMLQNRLSDLNAVGGCLFIIVNTYTYIIIYNI